MTMHPHSLVQGLGERRRSAQAAAEELCGSAERTIQAELCLSIQERFERIFELSCHEIDRLEAIRESANPELMKLRRLERKRRKSEMDALEYQALSLTEANLRRVNENRSGASTLSLQNKSQRLPSESGISHKSSTTTEYQIPPRPVHDPVPDPNKFTTTPAQATARPDSTPLGQIFPAPKHEASLLSASSSSSSNQVLPLSTMKIDYKSKVNVLLSSYFHDDIKNHITYSTDQSMMPGGTYTFRSSVTLKIFDGHAPTVLHGSVYIAKASAEQNVASLAFSYLTDIKVLGPLPSTHVDYKGELQRLLQSKYRHVLISDILDYQTISTEDVYDEKIYFCDLYLSIPGDATKKVFASAKAKTSKEAESASALKCLNYWKEKTLAQPMQLPSTTKPSEEQLKH
jgi:hypothetical protein